MAELMATLKAIYEREHRANKFAAAMQGVDIDESASKTEGEGVVTFEEIKARAAAKVTGNQEQANAILFGFDSRENGTEYSLIGFD